MRNVDRPGDPIEQPLRQALAARLKTEPSSECLDAAMVAAWAEGTLTRRARAEAEAHAADCVRCQAILVAMSTTNVDEPATPRWSWTMLGWLVPVGAAAAALMLWINGHSPTEVGQIVPPQKHDLGADPRVRPAGPSHGSAPTVVIPPSTHAEAAATAPTTAPVRAAPHARERDRRVTIDKKLEGSARQVEVSQQDKIAESNTLALAAGAAAKPESPSTPPPPPTPVAEERVASPPVAAPAVPRAAQRLLARAIDDSSAATIVASPDHNIRWRLRPTGIVDRSADGGATWQPQSTGVAVTLRAGSSPAPPVCWLVGPKGTVVISIDGQSWQRVPFPEEIELISVRATDDARATITAADGRTFTTTDRGRTWTRSSP